MACALTKGRKLASKKTVGGLEAIYFTDYGSLGEIGIDSTGEITSLGDGPSFFRYQIKGNSSLETSINSSRENGTTFYTSVLNVTLTALDKATQEELKTLIAERPYVVVQTYSGKFLFCGLQHGCEVTGGTIVTGSGMSELSGFTLVLEAKEKKPPAFTLSTIVTNNISGTNITPIPCN
jgi:hypothetical protein